MLRIKLIFLLTVCTLPTFASDEPGSKKSESEASTKISTPSPDLVVINLQMIEKFNMANYSSSNLSVNELLSSCNFNELKKIAVAYASDGLNISDSQEVALVINRLIRDDIPRREVLYLHSEHIE